ncbi:MAG: hypothetical protein IPN22_05040 [Bacteroidetes bacterium]|nr:hypothetical protein [Bacteroidota bacterium]
MAYWRSLLVWLLLMLIESIHGTLRLLLLVPIVGDFMARQIAVFTGALLIFITTYFCISWIHPQRKSRSLLIGLLWVILTILFEVLLGILVFRMSVSRIAEDYDILNGGLIPIGLLLMLFTPLAVAHIKGIKLKW